MQLTEFYSKNDVQAQLERIVTSRQFCNAPRLSRFLTYVVEQYLEGRADLLKGYTIGVEVFDRDPDFDPQTDTIVRVQARALRQKLEHYYLKDGACDPLRIYIEKGGYEPTISLVAENNVPSEEVLVSRTIEGKKPSIAVLPFEYMGPDNSYEYLALGLTEGCIAKLSCFRDIAVFSRSTTEKAKHSHWSIAEMYEKFAPDFVLEGSFRIRDNLAQARIKLIDASTDEVIMTDMIGTRTDTGDIYELQDEITALVAARTGAEAGPIGQYAISAIAAQPSVKWETYRWISQYYQNGVTLDEAGRNEIKAGLSQALEADPTSSEAYATIAMLEIEQYRGLTGVQGDQETLETALSHALLAVQYDPQNAMAHQSLAIAYFHQRRFVEFRAHSRRALALNPGHADMLAMFGICHVSRAEWAEATALLDRAIELNPLHPNWYVIAKAVLLASTTSIQEALEEMKSGPMPDFYAYHLHMIWLHVSDGDIEAAVVEKERLLSAIPDAEGHILRYFQTWCLADELVARISSALQKVGLHIEV